MPRTVEQMLAELDAVRQRRLAVVVAHEARYGLDYPLVLRYDQPEVLARPWYGAVIAPSSRCPGKWQVTYFDADGFSSDFTAMTREDALRDIGFGNNGWRVVPPSWLDDVSTRPSFLAGNLRTLRR